MCAAHAALALQPSAALRFGSRFVKQAAPVEIEQP
jgi:hypothetical protein